MRKSVNQRPGVEYNTRKSYEHNERNENLLVLSKDRASSRGNTVRATHRDRK